MDSPDEWFRRAGSKQAVALATVEDKAHCREAVVASGAAVEFALKGYIMKVRRLNRWPDRKSCPELHTHNLRALFELANLDHSDLSPALRASLSVVFSWSRATDYDAERMARRFARDMVDAAFGEEGVVPWLKGL